MPSASGSPVISHVWNATTVARADKPTALSPRATMSARNSGNARAESGARRRNGSLTA